MKNTQNSISKKADDRMNIISRICVLERKRQAILDQQHRDYDALAEVAARLAELKRSVQ